MVNATSASRAAKILFVCTGNICRSPAAEYICRSQLLQRGVDLNAVVVFSRGTSSFESGWHADKRMQSICLTHGVDLSPHLSAQVTRQEIIDADLVIAMASDHETDLKAMVPKQFHSKIELFLPTYAPQVGVSSVPDPYYGLSNGFSRVYDMLDVGCKTLVSHIIDDILPKTGKKNIK